MLIAVLPIADMFSIMMSVFFSPAVADNFSKIESDTVLTRCQEAMLGVCWARSYPRIR